MTRDPDSTDLVRVIKAARDADPGTRIEFRDRVVAHGERAIAPMSEWLGDERLAPFAIRVLERIGREPELRSVVVKALKGVDVSALPAPVIEDLDAAMGALGVPARYRAGARAKAASAVGSRGTVQA